MMFGYIDLVNSQKCNSHNFYKASYFCTNFSCVQNSTSFLCEIWYIDHPKNNFNQRNKIY